MIDLGDEEPIRAIPSLVGRNKNCHVEIKAGLTLFVKHSRERFARQQGYLHMTIDRRDPNSRLASRLTIVSYPAEIVACLLPELNGVRDQLNRMPLIQSNSNQEDAPGTGTLDLRLHRYEQGDEPAL